MYCVKNNDKGNSWYCLADDTYLHMYKEDVHIGEKGVEFYKANGATEYHTNKEGVYVKYMEAEEYQELVNEFQYPSDKENKDESIQAS